MKSNKFTAFIITSLGMIAMLALDTGAKAKTIVQTYQTDLTIVVNSSEVYSFVDELKVVDHAYATVTTIHRANVVDKNVCENDVELDQRLCVWDHGLPIHRSYYKSGSKRIFKGFACVIHSPPNKRSL